MTTYYKFLKGRAAPRVPDFRYRLKKWQPPVKGPIVPCRNGYHVLRPEQVAGDFITRDLFVAEVRGDVLDGGDKVVARECRIVYRLTGWNERTARLFAIDCAERVLRLLSPADDSQARLLVQAARRYISGEIGIKELCCTKPDAHRFISPSDASSRIAIEAASGTCALDGIGAARVAAWYARSAVSSRRSAERTWQSARLLDYAYGRIA